MSDVENIPAKWEGSVKTGVLRGLSLHLFQGLLVAAIIFLFGLFSPKTKNLCSQVLSFRLTRGALHSFCIWGQRLGWLFAKANAKQVKVF